MAISRMKQVTFEFGNSGECSTFDSASVENPGYTGDYRALGTGYSNGTDARVYIGTTGTYQIRGGAWVYHGVGGGGSNSRLLRFYSNGTSTENVKVRAAPNSSILNLYVLGTQRDTSIAVPYLTWYHIGWDIKIHSSTGWAYIYANGEEILSWSGNTGTLPFDYWAWGPDSGAINDCFSPYGTMRIDDIYIDDTTGEAAAAAPPILRFYSIRPDGNGNYADWVGSDADSTDNYVHVDEQAANGADYVETYTTDDYDSYTLEACPSLGTNATIEAVIPYALALRTGNTEKIAVGTRLSSTDSIGSDQTPGTGAWNYSLFERQTTKPGGGSWSTTDVDSTELVLKSRGSY